ncbi:TIGR04222 domain-containing membrane protein [Kibdelosporangium phytohabitans]|uniref:TIGR04222 domain-containing membrane protein n=1 Tax=Kibdelosporangium phytohabitans TaxID=860235 RepID=A0A0N9I0M3_9PSEU|nr:TIGR04222 domain-containing membrane protein [Kibdelosporangium phytohabitans]ALG08032.1 hypothetical protein AOZ06_14885 [Kibdelosporangium phytohabitans]MBE1471008.1 hypothetical protein [Kibdelosporangium phytohabitans]
MNPLDYIDPSVETAAILTGGRERVIETAVAVLLERESIRISRDGVLRVVGRRPAYRTELEQLVLTTIKAASGRTVPQLKKDLLTHAVPSAMAAALVDSGLLFQRWWTFGLRLTAAGRQAVGTAETTIGAVPSDAAVQVALHGLGAFSGASAGRSFKSKAKSENNDVSPCGSGGWGNA